MNENHPETVGGSVSTDSKKALAYIVAGVVAIVLIVVVLHLVGIVG